MSIEYKQTHDFTAEQLVSMIKDHYKDYLRVAVIAYDEELYFYEQCRY
ncbi:MAG: hypothetical protein MJ211_11920 [Bacteroidales bacterium]|nr:hypothetical protein [Bacteroidales bacterium]